MRATETVTNRLLLRIVFLAVLVVVLRESGNFREGILNSR